MRTPIGGHLGALSAGSGRGMTSLEKNNRGLRPVVRRPDHHCASMSKGWLP